MRVRRTTALVVALILGGGLAIGTGSAAGSAAGVARSKARPARPGRLLTASPMTAYLGPGVPLDGKAWRITYTSTSATGHRIVVSGTVLVPTSKPLGTRKLVGFAVGSQGLADRCAASRQLAVGTEYEASNVEAMLAEGWVVAVTDYPGLGTPGQHTYAIGRALGPSVLDSMRAARQLKAAHLSPHGPVAVMGYSEGGGAAGWAVQLQPSYAPDLKLVGAAVGGVIANLRVIAKSLDGGATSFLIPYAAIGMQAAYPHLQLTRYLTAAGRADIKKLEGSCLEDASADYPPFTRSRSITTRNLFTLPAVKRVFALNHLGRRAPAAPVLLQQSPTDEVLPYSQAVALDRQWCREGARVDFRAIAAPDHVSGGIVSDPISISWLADRFAGKKLGPQCAAPPLS